MLKWKHQEKTYNWDGKWGIVKYTPYIYSAARRAYVRRFRLSPHGCSRRYILNECHTAEKMANYNLRCQRVQWEGYQDSPFPCFQTEWNEDQEASKAIERAVESLRLLKAAMRIPDSDFEELEQPEDFMP